MRTEIVEIANIHKLHVISRKQTNLKVKEDEAWRFLGRCLLFKLLNETEMLMRAHHLLAVAALDLAAFVFLK